jgi:hypothetical protein
MGAEMTGWAGQKSPSLAFVSSLRSRRAYMISASVLALTPTLASEKAWEIFTAI